MTTELLVYAVVGKLLIFLGQKFPPLAQSRYKFVRALVACDLCLGIWVYTLLAIFLRIRLFEDIHIYVPILTELITGATTSFIIHLISIGWKEKFSTVIV